MAYYLRLGLILFVIAAVASGILAFVNGITRPMIDENQRQLEIQARKVVLPDAETFEYVEANLPYYKGYDASGTLAGYTFLAAGAGYSGIIQTMVGVTTDMRVSNIAVISQSETPGLGANCTRPDFIATYQGKTQQQVKIDKDGGEIPTITGATITTRALSNSIFAAMELLKGQLSAAPAPVMEEAQEEPLDTAA